MVSLTDLAAFIVGNLFTGFVCYFIGRKSGNRIMNDEIKGLNAEIEIYKELLDDYRAEMGRRDE